MAPTAYDDPETRQRVLWAQALSAIGLVMGLGVLIALWISWQPLDEHYRAEQSKLDRNPGVVVKVRDTSDDSNAGIVTVRFTQRSDNLDYRATIPVGNVGRWPVHSDVAVLTDESDPDFVTLPGENYLPDWFESLGILAVAAAIVAFAGGRGLHQNRKRRKRLQCSPWRAIQGDSMITGTGDSKKNFGYFPDFAPDAVWTLPQQVTPGPFVVKLAGDRAGIVVRRPNSRRLLLANPKPLGLPGPVRILAYARTNEMAALRVDDGAMSVYEARDANVADALDEFEPGDLAVMRRGPDSVAVMVLGTEERRVLAVRLDPKEVRNRWPALTPHDVETRDA